MNAMWAQVVSIILNPYVHPVYLFIVLCNRYRLNVSYSLPGILFIAVMPLIYHILLHKKGRVDIDVSDRRVRPKILLVDALFYAIAFVIYYLFLKVNVLYTISLIYLIVLITVTFVTLIDKVCLHVAGIILPSMILYYMGFYDLTLFLILISFMIAYARIKLKRHNIVQVIEGYIIPIIIVSFFFHYVPLP